MNKPTIEALTWVATLTGAVVSACSLAAGDAALPDPRLLLPGFSDARTLSAGPAHPPQTVAPAQRRTHDAAPPRPRRSPSQPHRSESWRGAPLLA